MIDTARLRLRRCRPSDVDGVLAYRGRDDVARHLSAGVWTRAKALDELQVYELAPFARQGDELVLLAETRDDALIAGEVGLVWLDDTTRTAEIGFVFNPEFSGRGLATEAVSALLDAAFHRFDFQRVVASTDEANTSSRRLCKRVGMRLLSTATSSDARAVPECTYIVTRDELPTR
jgi:RimJ/RimL family protein N-acetyltransferase